LKKKMGMSQTAGYWGKWSDLIAKALKGGPMGFFRHTSRDQARSLCFMEGSMTETGETGHARGEIVCPAGPFKPRVVTRILSKRRNVSRKGRGNATKEDERLITTLAKSSRGL